uniref:Ig-like domain-containing protein n=1 Tax=Ciona savignyi TaxID=51511 RepID=H2YVB4_CIOSA
MRCDVVAGIPTPVITWFAPDDTSALDHENITSGAVELRDSGATLVVMESKPSDSGWWRCTASNVEGSSEGRIRLSVKSRSTNNSSVIIIAAAAAAGLLLVVVVATAAICICRRKRKKMATEKESPAKVEETKAEEQGPSAKIEEEAYEPRFLPGSEQLQQPFEHVPEVRGFRL